MAKVYGGRWRVEGPIGRGGQGDVFAVADLRDPAAAPYALKRVRNPNRRARFEAEVSAIKSMDHPNVVKLVDHSALDADGGAEEKQFIVMPVASGGDLAGRVRAYKGSLDGALAVARPLASSLAAAHARGIIHRDVKPGNVLFKDDGNEPWLSDFGICLIRGAERATSTGEVAGPWAFTAPELEEGGRLDVTPAADVYSLGKLIYYMVTGGIVLPRERIGEQPYSDAFSAGGRYNLLQLLLNRMVCNVGERIQDMAEVGRELSRIADWDRNSVAPPFGQAARARIEALQRGAVASRRAAANEEASRQTREAAADAVRSQLLAFLRAELEKAALVLGEGGAITATVGEVREEELGFTELDRLSAAAGVELSLGGLSARQHGEHVLQLLVCTPGIQVFMNLGALPPDGLVLPEVVHSVLPRYKRQHALGPGQPAPKPNLFFLTTSTKLSPVPDPARSRAAAHVRSHHVEEPPKVYCAEVATSRWPALADRVADFVRTVCDNFLVVVERNRDSFFSD